MFVNTHVASCTLCAYDIFMSSAILSSTASLIIHATRAEGADAVASGDDADEDGKPPPLPGWDRVDDSSELKWVLDGMGVISALDAGWDGNLGKAPCPVSMAQAREFVSALSGRRMPGGNLFRLLEPSLHADGCVVLEIGDGGDGWLKFPGDGMVVYSVSGCPDGCMPIGTDMPPCLERTLSGLLAWGQAAVNFA